MVHQTMMHFLTACCLFLASSSTLHATKGSPARVAAADPVIDGTLGETEWASATHHDLRGGGDVYLRQSGDTMFVAVRGPAKGLASICVGDTARVRILHASAALGEAAYARTDSGWALRSPFSWSLRDSPRSGSPSLEQKRSYLAEKGWTANSSFAGSPVREYAIHLEGTSTFMGVTFLSTGEPMSVSYWPDTIADDCRTITLLQGNAADSARFVPDSWTGLPKSAKR